MEEVEEDSLQGDHEPINQSEDSSEVTITTETKGKPPEERERENEHVFVTAMEYDQHPDKAEASTSVDQDSKDILVGQESRDFLVGQDSKDLLVGQDSKDFLVSQDSKDFLVGQDSKDFLVGQDSKDFLVGQDSKDFLVHQDSKDFLVGQDSKEFLKTVEESKERKRTRVLSKSDLEMCVDENELLLESDSCGTVTGTERVSLLDPSVAASIGTDLVGSVSSRDASLLQEEPMFQTSFLSSSLPDKFPSYLTAAEESRESLSIRERDSHCQSVTTRDSTMSQLPPKSKHFLNFTLPPTPVLRSHVRHSSVSSKASLNFHCYDNAEPPEERSSLSDSESRKPRRQFLKLKHSHSATKLPTTSNLIPISTTVPKTPPVQVAVLHKEPVDGRHALNYGLESALDDMLSDIRMLSQESESEAEGGELDVAVVTGPVARPTGSPAGLRHRGRKVKVTRKGDKKNGRRRKKRKHDLDELDDDDSTSSCHRDIPLVLTCPVCLDVFYNAHVLRPCGHAFCEPCLRRLAKYSQDAMRTTTCPVCRNPIDTCQKDPVLTGQVEFYCPEDSRRRHRMERNNKYMRHPLPSSDPVTFSPKHQLSRIISRLDRNRLARRRVRVGTTPIRLDIWRFLSLAFGFVLLKGMFLMVMLCLYCMLYDQSLHQKLLEFSVSGVLEVFRYVAMATPKLWGFAGVVTFGGVFILVLRFTHFHRAWIKPFQENPRIPMS